MPEPGVSWGEGWWSSELGIDWTDWTDCGATKSYLPPPTSSTASVWHIDFPGLVFPLSTTEGHGSLSQLSLNKQQTSTLHCSSDGVWGQPSLQWLYLANFHIEKRLLFVIYKGKGRFCGIFGKYYIILLVNIFHSYKKNTWILITFPLRYIVYILFQYS